LIRFLAAIGRSTWRTLEYWNQVDGSLLAAAVSFYACFSVFPLIMILLSGFGFFLQYTGYSHDVEQQILRYLSDQTSAELAGQIHELLAQIETNAVISGPLGLMFLVLTALTLFVNFERSFAKIWQTTEASKGILASVLDVLLYRVRGFAMLLAIGFLILLNFFSNFAIDVIAGYVGDFRFADNWWRTVHLFSSISLNAMLFTILYNTLPKTKVPWRFAFRGGVLASVTWELGRYALALFVISDKYHAFGVVGVFMGLLMWTFYGASVVLLGATHTKVAMEEHQEALESNRLSKVDSHNASAESFANFEDPAYKNAQAVQQSILNRQILQLQQAAEQSEPGLATLSIHRRSISLDGRTEEPSGTADVNPGTER